MNCIKHPDKEAAGACVYCGKFHCVDCLVEVNGKNYCRDCVGKAFNEHTNNNSQNPSINIVNNNNSSSSASASAAINYNRQRYYPILPWYLKWTWIIVLGFLTGGIYWFIGIPLRFSWNSKNLR